MFGSYETNVLIFVFIYVFDSLYANATKGE